jgi:hypothetical protein
VKITIERADGTKVHIEGDEASVARIARELSPPPVQPIQIAPYYPPAYPQPQTAPVLPWITWSCGSVNTSDLHVTPYNAGEPS